MLNIDGKILDKLDADEYYLFSILLNYGTKSHPCNDVLKKRTGWGANRVQKAKNGLIKKNLIESSPRFKTVNGKSYRDSNEYVIKTKLASKYNGKKVQPIQSEPIQFEVVEIEVVENEVLQFEVVESEVLQNEVGIKVLKLLIIETSKLLKLENIKEEKYIKEISNLKAKVKTLKNKLTPSTDKDLLGVEFPIEFNLELIESFKMFLKMRKEIKEPFKSVTSIQTKINSLAKDVRNYGSDVVLETINKSIENQWRGIKVNWGAKKEIIKPIFNNNQFPYKLPEFPTKEARYNYFLARYSIYKESGQLDEYKANTEYRQRAIYQKDAERLCFELELELPKLLEIEFNYKPL